MIHPEIIITYLVVLFIGIPAMLKNWTAVALVGSFLTMQALWIAITQDWINGPIPLEVYLLCDFIVITAVFLKGPPIEREPARSLFDAVRAIWTELSHSDKIILALFLPCWAAYAIQGNDAMRYWILWTLGLLQFFVAGAEAFAVWRRGRAVASEAHPADWFMRQWYAVDGR